MPLTPGHTAAVVLNFNSADDTRRCIRALIGAGLPEKDIILVDNASADGSGAVLAKEFPESQAMLSGENRGYAGGNNLGIARAVAQGYRYVYVSNPDTIVHKGALEALEHAANACPEIAALGAVTLRERTGRVYYRSLRLDPRGGLSIRFEGEGEAVALLASFPEIIPTDFVGGASLFLRVEAVRACGMLDERFFMYWEETELCRRFFHAGWQLAVVRDAVVTRGGDVFVTPLNLYYMVRNAYLFNALVKERAPLSAILLRQCKLLAAILRNKGVNKAPYVRVFIFALLDAAACRWGKSSHRLV